MCLYVCTIVCSGSVVVTAYDSESGRPGSNPEWRLIYYEASITAQGLPDHISKRFPTRPEIPKSFPGRVPFPDEASKEPELNSRLSEDHPHKTQGVGIHEMLDKIHDKTHPSLNTCIIFIESSFLLIYLCFVLFLDCRISTKAVAESHVNSGMNMN